MFDVGYSELLVIAIVLIVVIGPKDLPKMLRAFGKAMTRFRQVSGDFRRQFDDALKEAELGEVKKVIDSARSLDPRAQIRNALNPLTSAVSDIKRDVMQPLAQGQIIPKVADMAPMPAPAPIAAAPAPIAKKMKTPAKAAEKTAKIVKAPAKAVASKPISSAKPKRKAAAK